MMRNRIYSIGNGFGFVNLPRLAVAGAAAVCAIGVLSAMATAQDYGPSPVRPLPPVLSEAGPPNSLNGAIDPDVMADLNEASADQLFSGGRAAFEDGRHEDAQLFFERLVARFSKSDEAVIARRYLAALYATVTDGQGHAAAAAAPAGMSMLGGDARIDQAGRRSPNPEPSDGGGGRQVPSLADNGVNHSIGFVQPSQYQGSVDEIWSDRLRLEVGDRVFFAASSADLGARARGVLSGQAKWLSQRPHLTAVIAGHADEQGSQKLNVEISARRAQAVRSRLIEEGVGAERIAVAALGRNEPVSPCGTAACASQNRRAVMMILNGRKFGEAAPLAPPQKDWTPSDSPRAW